MNNLLLVLIIEYSTECCPLGKTSRGDRESTWNLIYSKSNGKNYILLQLFEAQPLIRSWWTMYRDVVITCKKASTSALQIQLLAVLDGLGVLSEWLSNFYYSVILHGKAHTMQQLAGLHASSPPQRACCWCGFISLSLYQYDMWHKGCIRWRKKPTNQSCGLELCWLLTALKLESHILLLITFTYKITVEQPEQINLSISEQ